jgi:Viral BACON domain
MEQRKFLSTRQALRALPAFFAKRTSEDKISKPPKRGPGLWTSAVAFIAVSLIFMSVPAYATSNGISGYSGKTGSTCTSCHSSGTPPTVTLTGPASVASGSVNSYTLSVTSSVAGNGGLDVAATAGTFTAGTGTQVLNGELVHSSPSSTRSWTFSWTAPTVTAATTVTMYAAAIDSFSGGTGTIKQAITVTAAATNPTLTATPASLSFSYQSGGTVPAAQSVALSSSGSAISYTVSTSATWLTATPASGTTPGNVSVSVAPQSLAAGTYTGSVTLTSSGASNSPKTIPITLTVTATSQPTLAATPSTLSFNYTSGGATPAAQTVGLTSSSGTLSYTAASSAAWLTVTPASGSTPGSLSVGINPTGLSAGTYSGAVTVTAAGASNSPLKITVSLTVSSTSTNPSLNLTPGNLTFTYPSGSTTGGTQNISVASTGSALSFTAAASGGSWLTISPSSGSTTATVKVRANPTGLATGTYNGTITITASGAANSPQTVPVKLVIGSSGSGRLHIWPPRAVSFDYQSGQSDPAPKTIRVLSTAAPISFTASALGGTWVSVTPSGGTTPGSLSISANPTGLASGTYTATIKIAAPGSTGLSVPVVLRVVSGDDGGGDDGGGGSGSGGGSGDDGGSGGGGGDDSLHAWPYAYDPAGSNTVAATWLDGTGAVTNSSSGGSSAASTTTPTDSRQQGLLLSKTSAASNQAQAGVVIRNVEGITLTELGYDIRTGGQCTAKSPRFVVVTMDDVVHKIGCSTSTSQPAPAAGWTRLRFDPTNPAQTAPAIAAGTKVKSIYLVLDGGPETGASLVVLDNIDINGTLIGKQ